MKHWKNQNNQRFPIPDTRCLGFWANLVSGLARGRRVDFDGVDFKFVRHQR